MGKGISYPFHIGIGFAVVGRRPIRKPTSEVFQQSIPTLAVLPAYIWSSLFCRRSLRLYIIDGPYHTATTITYVPEWFGRSSRSAGNCAWRPKWPPNRGCSETRSRAEPGRSCTARLLDRSWRRNLAQSGRSEWEIDNRKRIGAAFVASADD